MIFSENRYPLFGIMLELKRQGRGDHEIWWNSQTRVSLTVDKKLRSRVTANEILKDAGLPKAF